MLESLLETLRCPVTKSPLVLQKIKLSTKQLDNKEVEVIEEGILFSDNHWFYPIIKGIPRLNIEATFEYTNFFKQNLGDYDNRIESLNKLFKHFVEIVQKKTKRTRQSFSKEWSLYEYESDKTWGADAEEMIQIFLDETNETLETLKNKLIFDAGCGNGALNSLLGGYGISTIAMDFSNSIERAYEKNTHSCVHYIQGNVQFPPVAFGNFDIAHSSGVLIATNNTELSFSCIEPLVKKGGKLSVWLYHPRKDFIHNTFNKIRQVTSKLPLTLQNYLYKCTLFPISYIIKRLKGNKQNTREMMVDIFDWFSPEFRWEHDHKEAEVWFLKRNYVDIKVTTDSMFGFSIIGVKNN
jgi:uncharacterized protein YbaR (Trm112 family)/2-polyprenyl-3-methyl-5-hydroxy-6-metoxy-1,4-benzoquinol methylase